MKKMNKILSVMMAAAMTVSMTACGGDTASDNTSASADNSAATTESAAAGSTDGQKYTIGILQQLEHPALDAASQGFEDALTELLGADNVTFDLQNAQGEQANCATIANNFVAGNYDLILANATTALQCSADWTGSTGRNISGTSDLAPLDEQEAMIKELFPDVKTVGILYCSAEPNSKYQATQIEAALDADGIAYKEYTASDSNDITSVVQTAVSEVDVIYIPTDNTMANNTETINNIALPAGIPIIAGEEGICSGCGVATLSISYYDIGYTAGQMAYDILVNGADITTMEIKTAPQVTKEYNADICSQLGITPPDDYVAIETE